MHGTLTHDRSDRAWNRNERETSNETCETQSTGAYAAHCPREEPDARHCDPKTNLVRAPQAHDIDHDAGDKTAGKTDGYAESQAAWCSTAVNVPDAKAEDERNEASRKPRQDRPLHAAAVPEKAHAEQEQRSPEREDVADPPADERRPDDQENDWRERESGSTHPRELVRSSRSLLRSLEVSRFHRFS